MVIHFDTQSEYDSDVNELPIAIRLPQATSVPVAVAVFVPSASCSISGNAGTGQSLRWSYRGILAYCALTFSHLRVRFQIATEHVSLPPTATR